ncbi:MAG: glycosyltransferase family 4 protein [Moraxellaceae bacterium]
MKILVVTNMFFSRNKKMPYAGVFVTEQVDALRAAGIDCDVYIIDGFRGMWRYFTSAIHLYWKLLFSSYDVIHVHYGLSGLFTLLNPFIRWRKVILTLHGGDILPDQGKHIQVMLTRLIVRRVGGIIILNEQMRDELKHVRCKIWRMPCGVDETLFNGVYDGRQDVVIFPSSPDRAVKNFPLFRKICTEFFARYGEMSVVFVDGLNREEVAELFSRASILLMTSISEGSPQVVKEALLCDLPVVSTDVGDVRDVVDGTPGCAVFDRTASLDQVAALMKAAINEANASPGERRRRVLALGLDQSSVIGRLIDVYRAMS